MGWSTFDQHPISIHKWCCRTCTSRLWKELWGLECHLSKPWLPSYSVDDKNEVCKVSMKWLHSAQTVLKHLCIFVRELSYSVQLRLAQLFFLDSSKSVHAWCLEAILIANNYTPGSSEGNICVLHTPKSNSEHPVSMVMTPPTVNKIIFAHRLQLFLKMRIVNTK